MRVLRKEGLFFDPHPVVKSLAGKDLLHDETAMVGEGGFFDFSQLISEREFVLQNH